MKDPRDMTPQQMQAVINWIFDEYGEGCVWQQIPKPFASCLRTLHWHGAARLKGASNEPARGGAMTSGLGALDPPVGGLSILRI